MPSSHSIPVWTRPPDGQLKTHPLNDRHHCDIAIVGGGILGLSAARQAARAGLSVQVIEAGSLGSGAAGLNGGQVIPGLKQDPEKLMVLFGDKAGQKLVGFVASTADCVFDLIHKEGLAVDTTRAGWIYAAHTKTALAAMAERNRQWQAQNANVCLLDAEAVGSLTGAQGYLGGWLDRRAGAINPLAYVLELARIAMLSGARVTESEKVTGIEKNTTGFALQTASGKTITATKVLVATNAYTGPLVNSLAQTIVPLHSFQIATARLPESIVDRILPEGQAVSDSRRIIIYYRKSPDGRLVFGGRGRMSAPRGDDDWNHLVHAMLRLFPALKGIPIEKRWFGRVCVTNDHLPHFNEPAKGLVTFVGCQGRGVALMSAMGPVLADYLRTGDPELLPFPATPIRPIAFHAFRQIGVAATIAWYRLRDAMEK